MNSEVCISCFLKKADFSYLMVFYSFETLCSGSDRSILRVIGDSRGRQYRQSNEQAVFGFLLTFGAFEHENQVTSFAPLAVKKSTVFIFQRFTLY